MSIKERGTRLFNKGKRLIPLLIVPLAACGAAEATQSPSKIHAQPSPAPLSEPQKTLTPRVRRSPTPASPTPTREIITIIPPSEGGDNPVTPTPERQTFNIYFSDRFADSVSRETLEFASQRLAWHLIIFPCTGLQELRIKTIGEMEDGNNKPGIIYLDPTAIRDSAQGDERKIRNTITSNILTLTSMICYEPSADLNQVIKFSDGRQVVAQPGLRLTIISPKGEKDESEILHRGVAIGLAAYSFGGEGFVTYSTADYFTSRLTYFLTRNDLETAIMMNRFKDEGNIKGFTSLVLGIDERDLTPDDVGMVLSWYEKASGLTDYNEFKTWLNDIKEKIEHRQNEKTNYNTAPDPLRNLTHQLATIKHQRQAGKLNQKQAAEARKKLRERIWIEKRAQVIRNESRSKEQTHDWLKWMKDKYGAQV